MMQRIAMLAMLLVLAVGVSYGEQRLTFRTSADVTYVVTADGLSEIRRGQRTIANGGWYAWNAGPIWFSKGDKDGVLAYGFYSKKIYAQAATDLQDKSIEILSRDHARVRHVQPNVIATYDYRFSGEDATITVRLENNHPTATLDMPAFGGLRFAFNNEPQGNLRVWHPSYLQRVHLGAFHPSHLNKIGGSYASDNTIGVGVSPVFRALEQSLIFWDYDKWNPDADAKANRWLSYLRSEPIPPGGARTFHLKLRVSARTDWKHLLEPYKQQFLGAFGQKTYDTDFRCVVVAHVNRNKAAIGPTNPYGFHGGFRRLDQPEQVHKLCDLIIPALQRANGHGLIIWGQGGQEPRGQMYRAEFDVLPPEVETNWTILAQRFREAGLRLGVCTRPRHMHIRLDWENDGTININPDDPQHLKLLGDRFQNMIDKGCTLFYLDSFGSRYMDVKIMRYLRERIGPRIQTYAEHSCDVMAVYSAFYSETDFWSKGSADWVKQDHWRPRTPLKFLEIVRWMLGPVPVITRAYDIHGEIPEGFESSPAFFYRNGLSPMIADYKAGEMADDIRAIQDRYVGAKGALLSK